MKVKLLFDNQELEVEITEEELKKLKANPKTGYERVSAQRKYYFCDIDGEVDWSCENNHIEDDKFYNTANYYSNEHLAIDNARADKLMRQLRRFAVEHRENSIQTQWYEIYCKRDRKEFLISEFDEHMKYLGALAFGSKEAAQLAIDTFHDELIWYFTEYKDSL